MMVVDVAITLIVVIGKIRLDKIVIALIVVTVMITFAFVVTSSRIEDANFNAPAERH